MLQKFYINFAEILQDNVVGMLSHCCIRITEMLQICSNNIIEMLQQYCKIVTEILQKFSSNVAAMFTRKIVYNSTIKLGQRNY